MQQKLVADGPAVVAQSQCYPIPPRGAKGKKKVTDGRGEKGGNKKGQKQICVAIYCHYY